MEKKECKSCMCLRVVELFSGKNLTCDKCLEKARRYRERNPEKVRETWRNQAKKEERIEKKKEYMKEYNKEYNQREMECEVCGSKIKRAEWSKHVKTRKHQSKEDEMNKMMNDVMGDNDGF